MQLLTKKFEENKIFDISNNKAIDYQLLGIFFENSPFATQALDENGHFISVSNLWLSLLGYSKDDVIDKFFGDFLSEKYKAHFIQCFHKFKEKGQISNVEFEMIKKMDPVYLYRLMVKYFMIAREISNKLFVLFRT